MRRLIAHIGLHKTGTTAFQQWLTDNRGAIGAAGIHVPSVGTMDAGNHRPLAQALLGSGPEAIASAFHAGMPDDGDVLITSEWLSSPRGLAGAQCLADIADRAGMAKRAILVTRDRDELLVSWYVQPRQSLMLVAPNYHAQVRRVREEGRFDIAAITSAYEKAGFEIDRLDYADARKAGIVRAIGGLAVFRGRLGNLLPETANFENVSVGALSLIACDLVRRRVRNAGTRLTPPLRQALRASIERATADLPYERFDPKSSPTRLRDLPDEMRRRVRRAADVVVDEMQRSD